MNSRKAFYIVFFVLFLGSEANSSTPEQSVVEYFDAFNARHQSLSKFLLTEELTRFSDSLIPLVKRNEQYRGIWLGEITETKLNEISSQALFDIMNNRKYVTDKIQYSNIKVIGTVQESKNIVHVVLRYTEDMDGALATFVKAISTKKENGRWKLFLSEDYNEFLQIISEW